MAVTKIRKMSSWTLLGVMIVSVIVFAMFYFGGVVDSAAEKTEPINTSLLLYWCYVVFGIAVALLLLFGLAQFLTTLKSKPKAAVSSLAVLIAFLAMLGITYAIGDVTPLPGINADSAQYNVASWLKISDMWIYSIYMGKKRKVPGINGSSSADIAFMLLLFFLLTTSMDTDMGLARRLPRPPEKQEQDQEIDIKKRNMLVVLISSTNQVLCGDEYMDVKQIRAKAKEFIANVNNDPNLPEKEEIDVPFFGKMMVTKSHIISLKNDRGTQYQAYINVQNELAAAYNELRDEISKQKWNKTFAELNPEQQKAVQTIYPQKISEAEPKNYGEKKTN